MKIADETVLGPEPVVDRIDDTGDVKLLKVYNWYNYFFNADKARKDVISYLKKKNKDDLIISYTKTHENDTPKWIYTLCRLSNKGTILDIKVHSKIILELTKISTIEVVKTKKVTVSRSNERAKNIIARFEEELDSFINKGYPINFASKSSEIFSEEGGKEADAVFVKEYYTPLLEELGMVYKKTDPELMEGYKRLSSINIASYIKFVSSLVQACSPSINKEQNQLLQKTRKPRKKKQKTPEQLTKRVKYLREYPDLKLKSVSPANIIGCSSVWLYNVKYKKLTKLSGNNLSILGTTVTGYDEKQSQSKKLRKPENMVKKVIESGKVQLRHIFEELTTKEIPVNGRLNSDTIILRVIK